MLRYGAEWRRKQGDKFKRKNAQRKYLDYYRHRDKRLRYGLKHTAKLKVEVLQNYSPDLRCLKCGFTDIRALSIDHINGNGNKHRKSIGCYGSQFYTWLKNHNYPVGYQVLCMNCNFIKRFEQREDVRNSRQSPGPLTIL